MVAYEPWIPMVLSAFLRVMDDFLSWRLRELQECSRFECSFLCFPFFLLQATVSKEWQQAEQKRRAVGVVFFAAHLFWLLACLLFTTFEPLSQPIDRS